MDFKLSHLLKDNKSLYINVMLYFFCALLVVLVFSYYVLSLKVYFQNQAISELNGRMATYRLSKQKLDEKKVLDYKKKIDDFSLIVSNHKNSSNIFRLIEENTLPSIWFSSFNMSQSASEVRLWGEAENMETLGRQIRAFEINQDYIKNVRILNSEIQQSGKVKFVLNFSLNPKVFTYGTK